MSPFIQLNHKHFGEQGQRRLAKDFNPDFLRSPYFWFLLVWHVLAIWLLAKGFYE